MFKNTFSCLQKIGKSLMLPVSVLPVAGILFGIGSANFTIVPHTFSKILAEAGGSVFSNMPLIFSIGIALGFTKNDGVAALAAVISHGMMMKTLSITLPIILNILEININQKYLLDTGILGGIISGSISAYMFNKFYRIQLPDYLGFFTGKRFIPIISGFTAILFGFILSIIWPPLGYIIKVFSEWAAYQNPNLAFCIYGTVERALVPFGLHHIWNVPFQMQIGEYNNGFGQIFHGDIARYMAGDSTAGKLSGGFIFKMYGLPGAALAIWKCANKKHKSNIGGIMISGALTAIFTGITEPIEFSFLLTAPILYVIHSILAGLAFPICILLDMRSGTSFSHGLIDFIVLSGKSNNFWLFPIIGCLYGAIYFIIFYLMIKILNLKTPGRDNTLKITKTNKTIQEIALLILSGLGGKKNIENLDSCITRLRITVFEISKINKNIFKNLGASGTIISGNGIQIVFGTKSEIIKQEIEKICSF